MLPETTRDAIEAALAEFDLNFRDTPDWQEWELNRAFKYALQQDARLYPPKKIASLATGMLVSGFTGGDRTNNYFRSHGFEVIPLRTQGLQPLDESGSPLDAAFSVLEDKRGLAIVCESRSGTKGTTLARNTQYQKALELILQRLAGARLTVEQIRLDPGAARGRGTRSILDVPEYPYPWAMADIQGIRELRIALCKTQAATDRQPGARGPGNPTKRILISIRRDSAINADELAAIAVGTGSPRQINPVARNVSGNVAPPPAKLRSPGAELGEEYREADELMAISDRDPFPIDPEVVERGVRGHASTQNRLAEHLRSIGLEPRSPQSCEPNFDIAWKDGNRLFVGEVKSITASNEERQLRLGLGQVLKYAYQLRGVEEPVPVLIVERRPSDTTWSDLCSGLGVILAWPDSFRERLIRGCPAATRASV